MMTHSQMRIAVVLVAAGLACSIAGSVTAWAQPPNGLVDGGAATPLASLTLEESASAKSLADATRTALVEGRLDDAARTAVELSEIRSKRQGPGYWEARRARVSAEDIGAMAALGRDTWAELSSSFALQSELGKALGDGDFVLGERLARQQAAIREKLLGSKNTYTAQSWNNVALFLTEQGQIVEAETLLWCALPVLQARCGDLSPDVAQVVHNLAWLTRSRGEVSESERLYARALEARRILASAPQGASKLAETLNGLASLYFDTERLAEAQKLYREANALLKGVDPTSPIVPKSLDNLAQCALALGETVEARRLVTEALDLRVKQFGLRHPDTLWSLSTLAEVKLAEKDLFGADALLNQVLQERREQFGKKSQLVADMLRRTAEVAFEIGDVRTAMLRAEEAVEMMDKIRVDVSGDERARAAYSGRLGFAETGALLAYLQALSDSPPQDVLLTLERTRARELLDLLARTSGDVADEAARHARESGDAKRAELILSKRQEESRLIAARDAADRNLADAELAAGSDAREKRTKAAAVFRESLERAADATAELMTEVRAALPQAQAKPVDELIESLAEGDLGIVFSWSEHGVVLLRADRGGVRSTLAVQGGEAAQRARELAEKIRVGLIDPRSDASALNRTAWDLLETLIPTPVRAEIRSAKRIILVPDGPLNALPFEQIFASDPSLSSVPLVCSPTLSMFATACDNRGTREAASGGAIVVVGDPVFMGAREAANDPGDIPSPAPAQMPPVVMAANQSRLFGKNLRPLPGTGLEAREIADIARSRSVPATLLLKDQATVPAVYKAAEGARILHLGTHGMMGSRANPFGAALALTRPDRPTAEDVGFLRLEDLIRTWRGRLKGTDLVVLSACNTQSGVRVGGSDFALPWGFFYAGAPSVVASLWLVDDDATSLLMTRFYQNLLGAYAEPRTVDGRTYDANTSIGTVAALREAQGWLRTLTKPQANALVDIAKEKHKLPDATAASDKSRGPEEIAAVKVDAVQWPYAHPYYWAGFVVVGSPD